MTIAAWTALTVKALNDEVLPSTFNGRFYRASNIGALPHRTGAAAPVWGTVAGGTTVDGNITWTCYAFSIRHRILKAIDTRFSAILVASGYQTNIGQNFTEWRTHSLPAGTTDCITVKDRFCSSTAVTISRSTHYHEHTLDIDVVLTTATASGLTSEQLRRMSADIHKAIGVDPTWSGLASRTIPNSDEMDIEQAEKIIGSVLFKFKIVFRTKAWNPYEQ